MKTNHLFEEDESPGRIEWIIWMKIFGEHIEIAVWSFEIVWKFMNCVQKLRGCESHFA